MRIELGDDDQPEIGLIALIDCIFFLLMFFMVATSFKQKEQQHKDKALAITLPRSSATLDLADAAPDPLVIRVGREGDVAIGDDKLSIEALHARLSGEAQAHPGRPVRIEGDGNASYQSIVHVLDLCQFEGLTNIAMRARRE
jgi:biopolymer transport protein ExbD